MVLIGDDPASASYIKGKRRACTRVGMDSVEHELPASASRELEVLALVARLNADAGVDGILVQLPLPKGLDADEITSQIDPAKDVDGLTPLSAGRLLLGLPGLVACTPLGIMKILERYEIPLGRARGGDRAQQHRRQAGLAAAPARPRDGDDVPLAHARSARAVPRGRRPDRGGRAYRAW